MAAPVRILAIMAGRIREAPTRAGKTLMNAFHAITWTVRTRQIPCPVITAMAINGDVK